MNASLTFPTSLALQSSLAAHNSERQAWRSDPEFQRFMKLHRERREVLEEIRRSEAQTLQLSTRARELAFDLDHQRKKVRAENRQFLPQA